MIEPTTEIEEKQPEASGRERRRPAPSFFWPLILIAAGIYFLLENLGVAPELNWVAALNLWPVLLIFIGLNLIARQAPRPLGTLFSFLLGIAAIGAFGFVLLADDAVLQNRLGLPGSPEIQTEEISWGADVARATATIDFHAPGGDVYALTDSSDLIAGRVSYTGRLDFNTEVRGNEAVISLDTDNQVGFFTFPMITSWDGEYRWRLGLSPLVPLDLSVDVGSGSVDLDLSALQLEDLVVDGGSGRTSVALPPGVYGARLDAGSGAVTVALPASGEVELDVDGGSGSLRFTLPPGMAARVVVDAGSGSFGADGRLRLVDEGDGTDVWETEGYDGAADRVSLVIDQGSGSVRIEAP